MKRPDFGQGLDLLQRNRDFRRLFLADVVSFMGDWFAFVAVSGLVKDLTGSAGAPAFVLAAQVMPVFFSAPLAGVLVDRLDRRRLMIASDLLRIVPALMLVVAASSRQAWLAYASVVTLSILGSVFMPASAAALPNLVAREDLTLAQTMLSSVWGSMLFVGAGIGGVFTATFGREASFLFDATTFAVSALLVMGIRGRMRIGDLPERATVRAHLGEVWRFVRVRKVTKVFMVTKSGVSLGNGILGLLAVYSLDRFGSGDAGTGFLMAARGVGALFGPFIFRSLIRGDGRRHVLACALAMGTYGVSYLFLPLAPSLAIALVCVAVAHAGGGANWALSTMALQMTTPDHVRGRVISLDFGVATMATGLSAVLAGVLADTVGLTTMSVTLASLTLTYALAWLLWTRDLWGGVDDPLAARGDDEDASVPEPALA